MNFPHCVQFSFLVYCFFGFRTSKWRSWNQNKSSKNHCKNMTIWISHFASMSTFLRDLCGYFEGSMSEDPNFINISLSIIRFTLVNKLQWKQQKNFFSMFTFFWFRIFEISFKSVGSESDRWTELLGKVFKKRIFFLKMFQAPYLLFFIINSLESDQCQLCFWTVMDKENKTLKCRLSCCKFD